MVWLRETMTTTDWLEIDGSLGEGGGQVLRSSLGLSLCTGRPVHLLNIRGRRPRPGLMRQHLTAVRAATALGQAEVEGDAIGSRELFFRPGEVRPGSFRFSIGTAGSTTLVLQAVMPALLLASGPCELTLEGGTHNPSAPPFDFLERVYLPLVRQMGPEVEVTLERPGFFPAGGGRIRASVRPVEALTPLRLEERGALRRIRATALVAALPPNIGHRELRQVRDALELSRSDLCCEELDEGCGPGNVVCVEAEAEQVTELFCSFGRKGLRAERVGQLVAREARRWLEADVPVGEHLADQLIPLLALAGGGSFRTLPLTSHARTQIDLVRRFLDLEIQVTEEPAGTVEVEILS